MIKKMFCAAAVACCMLTGAVLAGCTEQSFEAGSFSAEAVDRIELELSDTAVNVTASEDGAVHLSYYEGTSLSYSIVCEDGLLRVENASGAAFGLQPAAEYRTLEVRIPEGLEELRIVTSGESVTLAPAAAEAVFVDCNNGDISFGTLSVSRSASFTVKNGDITGTLAGGWDDFSIECTIKKGESNLPESKPGGNRSLNVICNNGDVSVSFELSA